VIDIIKTLEEYNANVTIHDPWADPQVAKHEYGVELYNELPEQHYDAIILAVAHNKYLELEIMKYQKENSILYDVKNILKKVLINGSL
jgi:UDP-N-acetyl-D-galactosamine dehydrogenase